MNENELNLLDNHVLILGHSDLIGALIEEIDKRQDTLLITPNRERAVEFTDRGVRVLTASPGDEGSYDLSTLNA